MKISSSLSEIVASAGVYQTTLATPTQPRGLSVEELALVHGGSGKGGVGATFLDRAVDSIMDRFDDITQPPAQELGKYLGERTAEALRGTSEPPPPPPPPPAYEEPIMSGEANMSMAGGGVGQDGTPVDDGGSHHYVWLPPGVNMSSADAAGY